MRLPPRQISRLTLGLAVWAPAPAALAGPYEAVFVRRQLSACFYRECDASHLGDGGSDDNKFLLRPAAQELCEAAIAGPSGD